MKAKCILICLSVLIVAGCSTYSCKVTPDKSGLIGAQYQTTQDSFLIENGCYTGYTTENKCLLIQVVGGSIYHMVDRGTGSLREPVQLPQSFSEFKERPDYYNDQYISRWSLFGMAKKSTRQDIIGFIPKGSMIRIINIVSIGEGDVGRCYEIYAELSSAPKDSIVEIPTCASDIDAGPVWFVDEPTHLDDCNAFPTPDHKYLIGASTAYYWEKRRHPI